MVKKLLAALCFVVATSAMATTYYVDNSQAYCPASDPLVCTVGQPCCTINSGLAKWSVAGDVVTVNAGTYADTISIPVKIGTCAAPFVLQGDTGETVILTSAIIFSTPTTTGNGQITIDNFTIRSSTIPAISVPATVTSGKAWQNIVVSNVTIDKITSGVCVICNSPGSGGGGG